MFWVIEKRKGLLIKGKRRELKTKKEKGGEGGLSNKIAVAYPG